MQSINNYYSCGYHNKYIPQICLLILERFKCNTKEKYFSNMIHVHNSGISSAKPLKILQLFLRHGCSCEILTNMNFFFKETDLPWHAIVEVDIVTCHLCWFHHVKRKARIVVNTNFHVS